jgi:hypothetical protein
VSVAETLLIYLVIPLGIVLLLAALVFIPGGRRRPRWKSGQAWDHEPVWYEPHPDVTGGHGAGDEHGAGHAAIGTGDSHAALTSGGDGVAAPAPSAGPLGGARGTW